MISVVMPSYQQAAFLEEAVRSVLDQQGVDVELLVLDPGSKDGSRELLQKLQGEYGERLRLFFQPDSGQSDAINRGMQLASGQLLGWLNSDDRLLPGALRRVAALLPAARPAWLYGRSGMIDAAGRPTLNVAVAYKNWRGRSFSRLKLLTENFVPQQATFWNRSMWTAAGQLNVELHLDMDYDLWQRFSRVAPPIVISDKLADFRIHADAKGSTATVAQLDAAYETAKRYATDQGLSGKAMLLVHRAFSLRTKLAYRILK